jgi:hypothetical protein
LLFLAAVPGWDVAVVADAVPTLAATRAASATAMAGDGRMRAFSFISRYLLVGDAGPRGDRTLAAESTGIPQAPSL